MVRLICTLELIVKSISLKTLIGFTNSPDRQRSDIYFVSSRSRGRTSHWNKSQSGWHSWTPLLAEEERKPYSLVIVYYQQVIKIVCRLPADSHINKSRVKQDGGDQETTACPSNRGWWVSIAIWRWKFTPHRRSEFQEWIMVTRTKLFFSF